MAHVGAKQILSKAQQEGYGVLCLLAGNLEMLIGAVQAAEELGAPLILAYNAQVTPQIPMHLIAPVMVKAAESARVPVATILDHGTTLASVEQAIARGFSTHASCSICWDSRLEQPIEAFISVLIDSMTNR